jgi:hypothetical protein
MIYHKHPGSVRENGEREFIPLCQRCRGFSLTA